MAPEKSGLHAHGEGELVITLESWEAARSSRGVEEGLSQSGCLTQPEDQRWLPGGEGIRDEDTGMSQGV